jgi:hypothetical protein
METVVGVTPGSSANRPEDRSEVRRQKDPQKSRITNGALLRGVDGRSPWVRRCKDIIAAHLSDLGGPDNTSAAERSIIRRAAVLTTELEVLEVRFATAGEACSADLEVYQRCANSLRRLLEAIGLHRRPRDITPMLSDILREGYAQQESEECEVDHVGD